MLVTSRSAAEYRAMFGLAPGDGAASILDCCAGGSSFAAETGGRVVAVDPAYALPHAGLAAQVRASLGDTNKIIEANSPRNRPDRAVARPVTGQHPRQPRASARAAYR